MPRTSPVLLLIAALAAGPLWPASAYAQQPQAGADHNASSDHRQDYKELARQGAKAFGQKNYGAAAEAFEQAYKLKPVPNLLYNVGRALEKQGKFKEAVAYYEKFVTQPDVELKARRDALQRLKTLREVIALQEKGKKVDKQQVDKEQGEHELASADSAQKAEHNKAAQPVKPPPTVVEHDYTLAYVFGGVGTAALVGSGVFALLAAGKKSTFDDATTLAERRDAADSGQTYTTVADSMLAAGAVLAGMGIYFWASPPEERHPATVLDASPTARLAPSVGADGASVTLTLDF